MYVTVRARAATLTDPDMLVIGTGKMFDCSFSFHY